MKNKKLLALPIGMILLGIGILMEKFLPGNNVLDFIEGFLIGLSMVLNIYYIFVIALKRKQE
jgi:hypothetical protein